MWKATITRVTADSVDSIAQVEFTYVNDDGRTKVVTERVSDPDSLTSLARNAVAELNRVDSIASLIANPPLGDVVLSAPTPTQEQLDAQALSQKRQQLIQLKQDVDLGLADQAAYDSALSSAKATIASVVV